MAAHNISFAFCLLPFAFLQAQDRSAVAVKSPIVLSVGCASTTAVAHIWQLSKASAAAESSSVGITAAEKEQLIGRAPGNETYHLIGVADFVDTGTARQIGDRGKIFSPERVNSTGMLVNGSRVAVKGLYVDGKPPRINLTSVVFLGGCS